MGHYYGFKRRGPVTIIYDKSAGLQGFNDSHVLQMTVTTNRNARRATR